MEKKDQISSFIEIKSFYSNIKVQYSLQNHLFYPQCNNLYVKILRRFQNEKLD